MCSELPAFKPKLVDIPAVLNKNDFINPEYEASLALLNPVNPLLSLRIYQCDVCDYKCSLKKSLHMHTKMHLADNVYKCGECGFQSATKPKLNKHIAKAHLASSAAKNFQRTGKTPKHADKEEFRCELCDYSCDKSIVLKNHFSTHFAERPFVCNRAFCMFLCATLEELEAHLTNHPDLKLTHKCKLCTFEDADKTKIDEHMMLEHAHDNPFKCGLCEYVCSQRKYLWKHKQKHLGGQVSECPLCDYCCSNDFTLQKHMIDHDNGLRATCGLCAEEFDEREDLLKHVTVHFDISDN